MPEPSEYRNTLNLPRTDFAMKADLVKREPDFLRRWDAMKLYDAMRRARAGRRKFVLHDGPPYANGASHLGHLVNNVLKDAVLKYKFLRGFDVPYVPGWDCHGQPIEHAYLKSTKLSPRDIDPLALRKACAEYARKWVTHQMAERKRLGLQGDWERPYLTMDKALVAREIEAVGRLIRDGFIYRGKKPVLWCATCETALAENAVEHKPHTAPSIYVKFRVTGWPAGLAADTPKPVSVVIWTTTPWTLPANVALAFHPQLTYDFVDTGDEVLVLARELAAGVLGLAARQAAGVIASAEGKAFEGVTCAHPFMPRESKGILADYVSSSTGTGVVHIAPGHGEEDWRAGQTYRLPVLAPVDGRGRFTPEVPEFAGQFVFKADPGIIDLLKARGALLHAGTVDHSYPHCWRCKKPVLFRATEQWFMSLEHRQLKLRAAEAARKVAWHPAAGAERMGGMIDIRPDWCISRQRVWGVPIPVFYCTACQHPHVTEASVAAVRDWVAEESADTWWVRGPETLLPAGTRCESCGGQTFRKETDTLDVWFDSGMTHATVLEASEDLRAPADLYVEAHDQFRGWFQSSLLTSVALHDRAPYKDVLVHGWVLDPEGDKMSKSMGNVVTLSDGVNRWGADVMRWWTLSEEFTQDMRLSAEAMDRIQDAYRKLRNTLRYLLGNLGDWKGNSGEKGRAIDGWMRARLNALMGEVTQEMDAYRFHRAAGALVRFCTVDLSAIYLDVLKDRLYASRPDDPDRKAAQDVLAEIVNALTRMLAPFLPFTAEDAWQHLPDALKGGTASVHLADWPAPAVMPDAAGQAARWTSFIGLRDAVMKSLETARQTNVIDQPLAAKVAIRGAGTWPEFFAAADGDRELAELLVVSQARVEAAPGADAPTTQTPEGALWVAVTKADGARCDRCWLTKEDTGKTAPGLCDRCADAAGMKPA